MVRRKDTKNFLDYTSYEPSIIFKENLSEILISGMLVTVVIYKIANFSFKHLFPSPGKNIPRSRKQAIRLHKEGIVRKRYFINLLYI